jgi:hypothetical protein
MAYGCLWGLRRVARTPTLIIEIIREFTTMLPLPTPLTTVRREKSGRQTAIGKKTPLPCFRTKYPPLLLAVAVFPRMRFFSSEFFWEIKFGSLEAMAGRTRRA